jgi:NAD(P)H-hydrate epimerase
MKLTTSQQIRAIDRATIELFCVPGILLMENAALATVAEIEKRWPALETMRIAIVCGKGNNGGDGLAIGRRIATRYNAAVTIWLTEDPEAAVAEEFKVNLEIARRFNLTIRPIEGWDLFESELASSDLIVDAVLGTGISGDPKGNAARGIAAIASAGRPVVSVDVPSGLNCDTGTVGAPIVKADVTVTFGFSKPGLHLYPGVDYAGDVVVAEIGYPKQAKAMQELKTLLVEKDDVAGWLPSREQNRDSNKGKYKRVALFAGSPGFVGAACLTALGAARMGAGLVTLGVPKAIFEPVMSRAHETVMTAPLSDTPSGAFSTAALKGALAIADLSSAAAIGPGIGNALDGAAREFVQRFVKDCPIPLVVDADGLNYLSTLPDHGASIVHSRAASTILTPHPGELGRLLGVSAAEIQENREAYVRQAALDYGAIVILKGSRALTAAPDGRLAINTTGNPSMASGGSGDVLTGVAATLLAQIDDPWQAAVAAAFLHGLAGDIAASKIGQAGSLATDLAAALPAAQRLLLAAA